MVYVDPTDTTTMYCRTLKSSEVFVSLYVEGMWYIDQ